MRDSAGALTEGGFATVMCNWIHREGDLESPVREWVTGLGCDALLLHHTSLAPLDYAVGWNRGLADDDPAGFSETVDRWVSHYRQMGIGAIATGFIVLRRRAGGTNWIRPIDGVGLPVGAGGQHLARMFTAGEYFDSRAGAGALRELLSTSWRLIDGHRLDQSIVYRNGDYTGEAQISQQPPMGVMARIDSRVLPVLLGCDGRRTLGQLIRAIEIPEGVDRAAFHSLCLTAIRDLIARGYLVDAS
ncbi:MAG: hypothetical protein ACR2LK_12120 [Solirubrobacteraceae bacterium]